MVFQGDPREQTVMATGFQKPAILKKAVDVKKSLVICHGGAVAFSRIAADGRTSNEDAAAIIPVDESRGVLAVADGCGGMARGELAARIAIHCLMKSVSRADPSVSLRGSILDGIENANRQILKHKVGAATTLAVVEIDGNVLRTYHVGDSQVLLVGGRGKIKIATTPHSPVGYAEMAGMLSSDEAMTHDDRHVVSNVVGSSEMNIEIGSPKKMAVRDTLLVASDGLLDNLPVDDIAQALGGNSLDQVLQALEQTVDQRINDTENPGKIDDLTFVIFRRGEQFALKTDQKIERCE